MTILSASTLIVLGISTLATAQPAVQYVTVTDSGNGYWRAHTDPALGNTTVRFFNRNRQVLYEETLNGRYFDFNRSNVSALDNLLAKLMANELVKASVKAKPLASESVYYKSKRLKIPAVERRSALNRPEGFEVHMSVLPDQGKLLVEITNPPGYRVHLYLEDSQGQALFYNSVVKPVHVQRFGLNDLTDGTYTVRVTNYNQKFQHRQKFEYRNAKIILLD